MSYFCINDRALVSPDTANIHLVTEKGLAIVEPHTEDDINILKLIDAVLIDDLDYHSKVEAYTAAYISKHYGITKKLHSNDMMNSVVNSSQRGCDIYRHYVCGTIKPYFNHIRMGDISSAVCTRKLSRSARLPIASILKDYPYFYTNTCWYSGVNDDLDNSIISVINTFLIFNHPSYDDERFYCSSIYNGNYDYQTYNDEGKLYLALFLGDRDQNPEMFGEYEKQYKEFINKKDIINKLSGAYKDEIKSNMHQSFIKSHNQMNIDSVVLKKLEMYVETYLKNCHRLDDVIFLSEWSARLLYFLNVNSSAFKNEKEKVHGFGVHDILRVRNIKNILS